LIPKTARPEIVSAVKNNKSGREAAGLAEQDRLQPLLQSVLETVLW